MKNSGKNFSSGISTLWELIIRFLLILFIPIYLVYNFLSRFIKNVLDDVYGRLVKYTSLIIFLAIISYIFSILKKN